MRIIGSPPDARPPGLRRLSLLAVSAALATLATGCGGKELLYETEGALRAATNRSVPQELATRGHQIAGKLKCARQPGSTKSSIRLRCTGTTSAHKPVIVLASVEQDSEDSYFTILVDGRPVVENVRCLGQECKKLEKE
jgi:hypothetical protein